MQSLQRNFEKKKIVEKASAALDTKTPQPGQLTQSTYNTVFLFRKVKAAKSSTLPRHQYQRPAADHRRLFFIDIVCVCVCVCVVGGGSGGWWWWGGGVRGQMVPVAERKFEFINMTVSAAQQVNKMQ